MRRRITLPLVVIVLCLVSMVGVGYAYQSSITSGGNAVEGHYVTLTAENGSAAILNYTQEYDTYTDEGDLYYILLIGEDEDTLKLNEEPYTITIEDSTDSTYNLRIDAPFNPLTWTQDLDTIRCEYYFEVTVGDAARPSYFGILDSGTEYKLYAYELNQYEELVRPNALTEAALPTGTYHFDVYLKLHTVGMELSNGSTGVYVPKTEFVDQFVASGLEIEFTAVRAVEP